MPNLGLVVSLYDIASIEGGFVYPNDGAAYFTAKFRLVVFRPFPGEVSPWQPGLIRSVHSVRCVHSEHSVHCVHLPGWSSSGPSLGRCAFDGRNLGSTGISDCRISGNGDQLYALLRPSVKGSQ